MAHAVPEEPPKISARRRQALQPRAEQMHELPFRASDLQPGFRNSVLQVRHADGNGGSQRWGYDIGQMKYDPETKLWKGVRPTYDPNNPSNQDYYVYGQPVNAMSSGWVVRCWQNAPENPRPFSRALGDDLNQPLRQRRWLHQMFRARRMPGGGNLLWILEDDGDLVLYAHAQPGTIPEKLCPNNAMFFTAPDRTEEADVPEDKQVRVEAGQFLFLVGNSGSSSGPHLHVHQQDSQMQGKQFRFRRGLASRLTQTNQGYTGDINDLASFRGSRIPDGPVVIWPPMPLGAEYRRHGFPAANFQRVFLHLSDSGYWLECIDGYNVAGQPFLNYVWRPAQGPWRAYFLVSANIPAGNEPCS